jgi:ribosomal protein S18 acetylase RimI-like enzyme
MSQTIYQEEWQRQRNRAGLPARHLPVHRWYLRLEEPWLVKDVNAPMENLSIMRAHRPSVPFYRFLYHTAGEQFFWGDRRRKSDTELAQLVNDDSVHLMVLYRSGSPAGFFEMLFGGHDHSEIKYFALLPGQTGQGLGSYMLHQAITYGGQRNLPLLLDTCTLDHGSALENYLKRGFVICHEEDEEYPDPRLDGTIPSNASKHVPLAE